MAYRITDREDASNRNRIATEPDRADSSIIIIVVGAAIVPRSFRGRLTTSDVATPHPRRASDRAGMGGGPGEPRAGRRRQEDVVGGVRGIRAGTTLDRP